MFRREGLWLDEYKTITKQELKTLLDVFPDDEKFKIMETKLGVTIIPIGEKIVSKEDVMILAGMAKTLIFSNNSFLSQIDMHSVTQDIFNIKRKGTVNTLLMSRYMDKR